MGHGLPEKHGKRSTDRGTEQGAKNRAAVPMDPEIYWNNSPFVLRY